MLSTTIIKTQHEGKYFGGTFSPFSRFSEICRQHASIYWSSPTPYEDKLIELEINYLSVSTSLYLESHGKIPEMVHIMQKKNIEKNVNFCQSRMMISTLWPKQGILGFRQFRSVYNFTDRLNKIYKIYHQSPSITEKMCMQTSAFIGKKNNNLEFQSTMHIQIVNAINIIPLIIIHYFE